MPIRILSPKGLFMPFYRHVESVLKNFQQIIGVFPRLLKRLTLFFILFLCLVCTKSKVSGQSITNYNFAATSSTFTSLASATSPALSGGDTDDGYFNAIPVGFDFWYMGSRYSTVSASTNGWLTPGTNVSDALYLNNLATGTTRPLIAPLWDDLDIISATNFSYKTTGSAGSRIFTMQWLGIKWTYQAPAAIISFQVRLYEGSGKIEFQYQQPNTSTPTSPSASIGISATGTGSGNYLSLNNSGTAPTANSTTETATINAKPANGQLYSFTPPAATSPSGLTFSSVANTSMTLNWIDNASNERGYVIYMSADGGTTYNFVSQSAANTTSSVQSGLSSNTTYFWKVYAVTEGALSASVSGSQATTCTLPSTPAVTTPVNYCLGATAVQLTATGSNLAWTTGGAGSVGGTTALSTTTYVDNNASNKKTNFSTAIANVSISKVDFYIPAYQAVNALVLGVYNSSGVLIATSSTTTTQTAGATAFKISAVFSFTITASGNYSIGIASGTGNIGSDNPAFPITELSGVISLTGVSATGIRCFNNIIFTGATSATAPTPLTITPGSINYLVTQTTGGCTSLPATITVNVSGPNISQVPVSGRIGYYKFEGNANDADGLNNGTLQNAPSASPDRFNISNRSYTFNGSTQYVSTANSYTNPSQFTISIWFKTTAVNGGRLIGFGTAQTGQSGQYDRHLYMNNAGQIYFGVYPGSVHTINSTLAYNDGAWHLATASLSSAGMVLYIDGAQVAADPSTTAAENYTGYWRIGYDNNNGWTSQPSNYYFTGALDEALIYQRALTATEIGILFNSPDGAGNTGPVCIGSSVNLTATTLPSATYAWSGPGGFSSTSQNPSFTYALTSAGTYTLQVTVAGCSVTAYTNLVSTSNAGQWTGNVSSDWATAANWCTGAVPAATTNVIITSSATRMPSINSNVVCNSLTINSGATLAVTGTGILNISGTLTNNGTVVNNGTTNFNGSAGAQSFSGINSFYNLTVSNPAGLNLSAAITINNNLLISAGTLNAANNNITIKGNFTNNSSASGFTASVATVTFSGTAAQSLGGTFTSTFYNLVIANTGSAVSLGINTSITRDLTISTGTFDLGSFTANRATAGGTLTVSNNAVLKIGGINTFPANYTTNTLVVASIVEYSGTNQTVANQSYGNLVLSSSAGDAIKTFPATALSIVGNLSSVLGAGTSVSFTAAANITVNGNVSIGASTTFNAASYSHTIGGNWVNAGVFNGNTSTITFNGSGSSVSGSGAQNFNNLTIGASLIMFSNSTINVNGNFATSASGSFTQASGGTLIMTGTSKTISGAGISIDNLTVSGTITTSATFNITGNIGVSGSFTASAGTITMTGTSRLLSGAGTKSFSILSIQGSITTDANFSITSGLTVTGTMTATAGGATFTGTSSLSGTANLFNVIINGTSLQLSANSVLGIANSMTITAGALNVTASTPNKIDFNGGVAQNINAIAYNNLAFTNGSIKTALGNIVVNNSLTIGTGTTFNPGAFTHSVYVDWNNYGFFTPGSSTIQFLGNQNSTLTGATTFNVLSVNNSNASTGLTLLNNITASVVNMTMGTLFTGSNKIIITSTRYGNGIILGNIQRTHSFTTGVAYAFEGPDNLITFSAVSGVTSITVSVVLHSVSDFPYGNAISREYSIAIPAGTYTAALRLHYNDLELNGNAESAMGLWNYTGSWIPFGKSGNSAVSNYVEQTGLTSLIDRWTCSFNPTVVQWNGSVSTDWNNAANWTVVLGSATAPPSPSDVAVLGTASFSNQPSITTAVNVKNIVFGTVQPVNLSMNAGGSLISGDIIGLWSNNITHAINVNNQSVTINGDLSLSDGTTGHAINLNIGSGTISVSGSLQQQGGANINFTGAGNLNIGGNHNYVSGAFTPGAGTVTYNGVSNQVIGPVNYNNLVINNAAAAPSINNATTIAGNLTISAGELDNYSNTIINGNVTIASGATLDNHGTLHVGGNWINNGTFTASGTGVYFDGSGAQSISASTFNNLYISKPSGIASLSGNVVLTGDLSITSGTLDIKTYSFDRNLPGGAATTANGATFMIGADNAPKNFVNNAIAPASTTIFYGTASQFIGLQDIAFGNLIFRGSGVKTVLANMTVNGDLTIENNSTLDATTATISLNGSWLNSGTFTPSSSTVLCLGSSKNISGNTIFNKLSVYGSYTILNNVTFNGLLTINPAGSFSAGSAVNVTMNGDLVNKGILYTLGTTTFTGNVLQTLSLINAVQTVAITVNFNGSVSPVLNSTSAPQFGYLNINNTGGVNPSVGWTIAYALTVGSGASFNGGASTHNILGSLTNNGTITSTGRINFLPSAASTLNFGTGFTSTGRVTFGGTVATTIAGTPVGFNDVIISNTNAAGITPSSAWIMTNDFTVMPGAVFNAGSYTHTVGRNILVSGTMNAGTSTFTLNGSAEQDITSNSAFHNIMINKASGVAVLLSDALADGVLHFVSGKIQTGNYRMSLANGALLTGASAARGWVNGNLQKYFSTGASSKFYEIGDASNYTPVRLDFNQVTTAGNLTVSTTAGDHLQISNSRINSSLDVNRFWTLTNSGMTYTYYDARFNFLNADTDAGATPSAFGVSMNNGGVWTLPAVDSANNTNIKALNLVSTGDIAIGEVCNRNTAIVYNGSPYCAGNGTASVLLTGNGGGIYSSTAGLIINAATGQVNLGASTPGNYVITYSIAAAGSCGSFVTSAPITISPVPQATINYPGSPYCLSSGWAFVNFAGTTGGIYSSTTGLSINASTGQININTSTAGTYTVTYTVAAANGCAAFSTTATVALVQSGSWTGAINTDWNNSGNWLCGAIPGSTTNVLIQAGMPAYPVLTTINAVNSITIRPGASMIIQSGTLRIRGAINNLGYFNVSEGTIEMNGSSPQTIPANAFTNNSLLNLVISNNVTLAGQDTLTGTLYFSGSNKTLNTNDLLTLKSTATATARIDDLTNGGVNSGNAISGKVNIERYIPLRKAWRLLSVPVKSANAPTINTAWQEGATTGSAYPNPTPGYGVEITGGTIANGFDQSLTNSPSIKVYSNATGLFSGLPSTPGTNIPVTDYPGYFLYVRGDRSINLMQGTNAAITATTLRMKGEVISGSRATAVNGSGYTIFGNPYPSAIDFQTLTKTNVKNGFYVWDPKLAGINGLGDYVTFLWNSSTNSYDATASASSLSQYIPSGEAIMVESGDGTSPGTLGVQETDKTPNGAGQSFSRSGGAQQQVRINLQHINPDSTVSLLAGVLTTYDNYNSNEVDNNDAKKINGGNENIGIKRPLAMLSIERRKAIIADDTTFLNLYQLRAQSYRLEISAQNMSDGLTAVIKDNYSETTNNQPLDLNGVTYVDFVVNADPASYNVNRFSVVFKMATALPVTFTALKAYAKQKTIAVEWKVQNEINIHHYEVEKSADGSRFTRIANVASSQFSAVNASYVSIDPLPFNGNNYYRIKSVYGDGGEAFSKIVLVNMFAISEQPKLVIAPNPVTGRMVSLQFSRMKTGTYTLQLFNKMGQLVQTENIYVADQISRVSFELKKNIPAGIYDVDVHGEDFKTKISLIRR